MTKTFMLFTFFIMAFFATSAQTTQAKTSKTKQLPDCVLIKNGKLQAKAGYTVIVSPDGKTFTVGNAKGIGGTFTCNCSVENNSNCTAMVSGGIILCNGNCNCMISVVISGVTYTVDFSAGVLRKN